MKGISGILLIGFIGVSSARTIEQRQTGTAVALEVALPAIKQLVNGLGDHLSHMLFDKDPYTTIMHRSVKLTESGNTITIQDLQSGITVSRTGANPKEALENATQDFITTLVEGGYISTHDLHLAPVITSIPVPCGDTFPESYCLRQKSQGYCNAHSHMYTFMKENCYKSCTSC